MSPAPRIWAGVALAAIAGASYAEAADHLVLAKSGGLPIIITAPHGGSNPVPGTQPRMTGKILKDEHTLELAETLADRLEGLLGTRPYVVAARFSRRYIDANRSDLAAYATLQAKPFYDEYHGRIREFVAEIRRTYPGGALLIDIHGQSADAQGVYRGTRQGTTVDRLLNRSGCPALTGEKSILGALAAKGYRVIPDNNARECLLEDARYVGGYTVATYGSHHADGIDAIQLELGGRLRSAPAFANDLAQAIAVFYANFLAEQK